MEMSMKVNIKVGRSMGKAAMSGAAGSTTRVNGSWDSRMVMGPGVAWVVIHMLDNGRSRSLTDLASTLGEMEMCTKVSGKLA